MAEEITSIRVPGTKFDIQLNSIYSIEPKYDMRGAPQAYKRAGFTKVPNWKITTTVQPRFDESRNLWDLALDKTSPAFNGLDTKEVNRELRILTSKIINPLMAIKPEGFLDIRPKKEKEVLEDGYIGLETHEIVLGLDRQFDTSKVEDLFNLYTAIYNRDICPKEYEDDPAFNTEYINADFCVANSKQTISRQEEKQFLRDKAVSKLMNSWEKDKDFTLKLLKYCAIAVGANSTEQTVVSFFRKWLDDKDDRGGFNAKYFLENYDKFLTEEGAQELYVWITLDSMFSKREITKRNGEYFRGSDNLGANLKVYAKEVLKDQDKLKEILGETI